MNQRFLGNAEGARWSLLIRFDRSWGADQAARAKSLGFATPPRLVNRAPAFNDLRRDWRRVFAAAAESTVR